MKSLLYQRTVIAVGDPHSAVAIDHRKPLTEEQRTKIERFAWQMYRAISEMEGIRLVQIGPADAILTDLDLVRLAQSAKWSEREEGA